MSLLRRKSRTLTPEQQQMAQWLRKVWCPLHIKYPSARDNQATQSAAMWLQGHPDVSFLAATGNATLAGWADRWSTLNPGEDPWEWLESTGDQVGQRMAEDPAFRKAIERSAEVRG